MYKLIQQRTFLSYIDRSREYYAAQGYTKPYEWPHYNDAPFAPLQKPLAACRVGLVTTAGQPRPAGTFAAILTPRDIYAQPVCPPPRNLFTDDLGWDKEATHTKDVESFLPLSRLHEYEAAGRIGSVAPRFYGVPTDYSQKRTLERHAPQILGWCREDSVDALLLAAL
ncbi:MAG TPA: hypothetical protein PK114_06780 [Smithellaceae bacterium]|nr:hypothetical protein [Smithellaceae bacterium]